MSRHTALTVLEEAPCSLVYVLLRVNDFDRLCRNPKGFVTKVEANLAQPAEEALLIEGRRDSRAYRFDGNTSWLRVTSGTGLGFLHPTSHIVTWRL
jgi:hypothetical protein